MPAPRQVAVRAGGLVAEVIDEGRGSPVLFLHGTFGLRWGEMLGSLSARRRVVAPVLPGYGDVAAPESLLDIHDLVYYYLDLLDELRLSGIPVVGHSFGGMVAAELAAAQPDRFTKLVLISPLGLWDAAHPVADFFAVEPKDLPVLLFHDPESAAALEAVKIPTEGDELISVMLERAKSLATAARYLWPIPDKGLKKRIHRVKAPTLLVWGRSDKLCPPIYARQFQALIAGSQVKFVENAGHLSDLEQPRSVANAVEKFLGLQR